jgi:predicted ArsR family transcriptional regulator
MVLLAIAADRRGASFYRRERMASALGMSRHEVDEALQRLLDAGLVVVRPWRAGGRDGVWQLLQPSPRSDAPRAGTVLTAADVLRSLGFHCP